MSKYEKEFIAINGEPFYADVYSVLQAFGVACPALQHAIKKLLMPGQRGVKSEIEDLVEAQNSLVRALQMALARIAEDGTLTDEPEPEPKPEPDPEPKPDGVTRLYVWSEFAPDHKNGLAVAMATSTDEARRLVVRRLGYDPEEWGPVVIHNIDGYQLAWAVTGGQ